MREGGKNCGASASLPCSLLAASAAQAQSSKCTGPANRRAATPPALGDGWTIASPESVGLDGARLCAIAARLKETEADVHAVVIVRHGRLVFEQYFAGYDEPWGEDGGQHDFDATTKHDMRSASKSVISLLVGIAIDRKLIASADEPVVKFFPEYRRSKSPGWDQITLRHLLTMSSGMQWDENRAWNDPERRTASGQRSRPDPLYPVEADRQSRPTQCGPTMAAAPICSATSSNALRQAAGSVRARGAVPAAGDYRSGMEELPKNGKIASAIGLRIRPRDAAKIGQLVLNRGAWDGRQIVSPEWIEQSVRPRFQAIGYFSGLFFYGQQWWLGRSIAGDRK